MRSISGSSSIVALPEDRPTLRYLAKVRWLMLLVALALATAGLATIHSASSELSVDYMPRQAIWVVLGLVVFMVGFGVDYLKLAKFALPIYIASLGLLVAVLLFGQEVGGARSWLGIGSWRLQPSELAKVATVLLLARYLAASNRRVLALRARRKRPTFLPISSLGSSSISIALVVMGRWSPLSLVPVMISRVDSQRERHSWNWS